MTPKPKPKPTDLLTARDIADQYGWPIRRAENVLRQIARRNGGPVTVTGVRRVFITRGDLESSIQRSPGASS